LTEDQGRWVWGQRLNHETVWSKRGAHHVRQAKKLIIFRFKKEPASSYVIKRMFVGNRRGFLRAYKRGQEATLAPGALQVRRAALLERAQPVTLSSTLFPCKLAIEQIGSINRRIRRSLYYKYPSEKANSAMKNWRFFKIN
jgi:hypothetical protein